MIEKSMVAWSDHGHVVQVQDPDHFLCVVFSKTYSLIHPNETETENKEGLNSMRWWLFQLTVN